MSFYNLHILLLFVAGSNHTTPFLCSTSFLLLASISTPQYSSSRILTFFLSQVRRQGSEVAAEIELTPEVMHEIGLSNSPYFDIMDYNAPNQIGYNQTLQEYLDDMKLIFEECFRVLDQGRRMCIVIADITRTKWSEGERNTGYLIPLTDFTTKICTSIGFQFLGRIIWHRVIAPKYQGNAMGSYPYPPNLWIKQEFDYILIYRKPGQPDIPPMKDRVGNEISKKEWFEMVKSGRDLGKRMDKKFRLAKT